MTYIDNRGAEFHHDNEQYLRDRIKVLESRVKDLEATLAQERFEAMRALVQTTGRIVRMPAPKTSRGGWGNV